MPARGSDAVPAVPARVSVVTPTLGRPGDVRDLIANLAGQTLPPLELIVVDAASAGDDATERIVRTAGHDTPFRCVYVRHERGTAVQRNAGIDRARGEFVAFIDDDVRLDAEFLARVLAVFDGNEDGRVGGVVGYRTNEHFTPASASRWRWYRRLRLLHTFEPGRYDFDCGYPINANLQPPFTGVRDVDFMTTSCAVWRRQVMDEGLRFDPFFRDYGVLEDAHFSMMAARRWRLLQCGDARCVHLHSSAGRENRRAIGEKCVVNYYFLFTQVARPLSRAQRFRFWRFQAFELLRVSASALRRRRSSDLDEVRGRLAGIRSTLFRRGAWS